MSRFATQLELSLERCRLTRVQLAEATGIPYRTLTNYALDKSPADRNAMTAICRALPEDEAAALVMARLHDECPEEFERLVRIELRELTLQEPIAPYSVPALPEQTRRAIEILAQAASKTREWTDILVDLARVVSPRAFPLASEPSSAHPPGAPAGLPPGWTPPPDTSLEHTPHPLEEGIRKKAAASRAGLPAAPGTGPQP
jgi:hypothetical protein